VAVGGGRVEQVRLLGLRVPGGRGSCGVRGARKKLGALLDRGDEIGLGTLAGVPDADRRGRLIRTVTLGPRDVGLALLRGGWAQVRAARSFDGIAAYLAAERSAERRGMGGWRRCDWR
jgi:endonuclease YncB( thermonuclease family)